METENPPQRKIITVEEFKNHQVRDPQPYRELAPISRDNFMSWITRGFAVSRGDPSVQYGYTRWSAKRSGFDFESTFKNFYKAGATTCLSPEEKAAFLSAYNRVKIHLEDPERPENPIEDINHLIYYFSDEAEFRKNQGFEEGVPENLADFDTMTRDELMQWADARYQQTLANRKEREKTP